MTDFAKLVLDADTKGLKNAERDLMSVSRSAEETARKVGAGMTKLGVGITAGVTAPLAYFAKGAFAAGRDAQELQSMFDQTFGDMSDSMNKWAETTGDAMGRSTQELQEAAARFQGFFKDAFDEEEAAKMSKGLTVLAQDVASFKNLTNEEANTKLFAAVTGEYESLKSLGVVINDNVIKAKAMEMGFGNTTKALTEQEKVLIRTALLQEKFADAQGDVIKTSSSSANELKRSEAAFEELQVTIGTKLIPVLTPLIVIVGDMLTGFSQLPDSVQTGIVAFGAIAAALGPVLTIMGLITTAMAPFIGAISGIVVVEGAFIGMKAAAIGLATAFGPMLLVGAAIAAAGYLIYQNWDKIEPVLSELWNTIQTTLGPPLQELIGAVTDLFTELWNGPLGEGIRNAGAMMLEFQLAYAKVMGPVLITAIKAVIDVFVLVFRTIGDGVKMVSAVFNGEWKSALELAGGIVDRIFGGMPSKVIAYLSDMVGGIVSTGTAIVKALYQMGVDMIAGLVRGIKSGASSVANAVKGLASDAVATAKDFLGIKSPSRVFMEIGAFTAEGMAIGIDNGISGIRSAMERLTVAMVDPALAAKTKTVEAFRQMASEIRGLMAELFPEMQKFLDYKSKLGTIGAAEKAGVVDGSTAEAMRGKLSGNYITDTYGAVKAATMSSSELLEPLNDLAAKIPDLAGIAKVQTVRIAESFKDMADKTLSALDRMIGSIKGGGFLDILSSVLGFGLQLGSIGAFGKAIQTNINKTPGRANGGAVSAGQSYLVGENRPEIFTPNANGFISPRAGNDNAPVNVTVGIDPRNGNITAYVNGQIQQASPALVQGGAALANQTASRMQTRSVRR